MAEQQVAELFARKHLLKFLYRNLHPDTVRTTKWGPELSRQIADLLQLRVGVVVGSDDAKTPKRHVITLGLMPSHLPQLDPATHNKIMEQVEEFFRNDFHRSVDQMVYGPLPIAIFSAIDFWRAQYGITEEDYPLRNSHQCYLRYERRMKRMKATGRPRNSRTRQRR